MTSTNLTRREETRIRRALRRRRRLHLGAATALGSLAAVGVSGAALGTAGANLRATAGIQLVNLAEPLLAAADTAEDADDGRDSAAGPDERPATDSVPDRQAAENPLTVEAGTGTEVEAPEPPEPAAEPAADEAARSAAAEAAAQSAADDAARAAVPLDDPAAAKAYAASSLPARGWDAGQLTCLDTLWTKESEWLTSALNPSSGAYGIAQSLPAEKMQVAGADWKVSYSTQINWGLDYIASRYGSPCGALSFHYANNWY
ncbi:hypothetical protein [Arthrobacter sp. zg-Y1171]|uniref:aggregation-promoting factor C-terminal-like domain-containing protein n=1 Tax=Arthrobacter sp. zg-Y1171 TaxID=2964610 RepID=UPI002106546C|nr:hypothetical protein [Arthrobacter sp. zg-Y1171]MCQ1996051.1 hypothetical protein [Arthrobacter sp. zg-Y1171]UWX82879.1 hypothetical protein N2L00_05570 [Arthrobacter sp. zg-Y1171]